MIKILYEDEELLVARKPAGLESQASRSFEPDMVSEIKSYLYKK
ncbi:MAG: RluA family pseudouridine synthase, partial [bacterium]|nr:RluA family pseudouridine synthase [bacterium]